MPAADHSPRADRPRARDRRGAVVSRWLRALPPALALLSLAGAPPALRAADPRSSAFNFNAPVTNFQVATFTPQGRRAWLVRGAKGQYLGRNRLDVTDLFLTVFNDDPANDVDSIFISPEAIASLATDQVHGPGRLRLITDDFEATGGDWFYDQRQKKVSIHKDVRVVFHARLTSVLR